jgi:drug/metabolite transporter (DMT)-like permease
MKRQGLSPALWMVLACVGMACISGMIKHISETLPSLEIVFFRNFFGLIALAPWFWRNGIEGLRTKRIALLAVRATTGLISTTAWFMALAVIPLADATALTFTAPLFATVGAVFFLSEVVHLRRWAATLIGFTGAMIVLRPGLQDFEPANFYAVLAAASLAVGGIVIKKLTTTESPTKCVAWAHLLMTPVSLVPALFVWQWPDATSWLWLICLGAATAIAHVSMARAIGMGDLTAVLPYDFTRLPFAAIVGFFAFNQIPDIWTWTGAGIIFISSIYITHRENRSIPQQPLGPQ